MAAYHCYLPTRRDDAYSLVTADSAAEAAEKIRAVARRKGHAALGMTVREWMRAIEQAYAVPA